jgi:hypothetical protein
MGIKKIATNIPEDLIDEATELTGLNQTQALIEGLRQLIARRKRQDLLTSKGKIPIQVDTNQTRKRSR